MKHQTLRFRRKLLNRYRRHLLAWQVYYTPARRGLPAEERLWWQLHESFVRARNFPLPGSILHLPSPIILITPAAEAQ